MPFSRDQSCPVPQAPIDECIALAKARASHATLDEDFAYDLEDIINSHREPLDPPAWN